MESHTFRLRMLINSLVACDDDSLNRTMVTEVLLMICDRFEREDEIALKVLEGK